MDGFASELKTRYRALEAEVGKGWALLALLTLWPIGFCLAVLRLLVTPLLYTVTICLALYLVDIPFYWPHIWVTLVIVVTVLTLLKKTFKS